jgi:nucleotidyltransferase/DNA polymerase involved in DNA repair
MAIFARFCPCTERASIDEAYLDLTAQINSSSTTSIDDNNDDDDYNIASDAPRSSINASSSSDKTSSKSGSSSSGSAVKSSAASAGAAADSTGATATAITTATAGTDSDSRTTSTTTAAATDDIECDSKLEGAAKTIGIDGGVVDAQHAFDSRLLRGAAITAQIRAAVKKELGYTVSGGIAHNK